MCLEKLSDSKVRLNKNGIGIGWKLFHQDPTGELIGDFKSVSQVRPRDKWLKEGNFRPDNWRHAKKIQCFSSHFSYPIGFHLFLTKEGAADWAKDSGHLFIIKVKFRRPVAKGLQFGHECVVAKEIFIPKEA